MAWARLAVVYGNSGEPGRAMPAYAKAFALSKNVSERERLYIEAHYYGDALGNIEKNIETLELGSKTYPLEETFPINLGSALLAGGRPEEALAANRKALELLPDDGIGRLNDLSVLVQMDRMKEAGESLAETQRLKLAEATNLLAAEYTYYYLTGDKADMEQVAAKVSGRQDEFRFTSQVAVVQEFAGQYQAAEYTWNQAAEQASLQKAPDSQASMILSRVSGRALAGNCQNAAQSVKAALALDRSKPTLIQPAFTASLCNDRADACHCSPNWRRITPRTPSFSLSSCRRAAPPWRWQRTSPRKRCTIWIAPNPTILSPLRPTSRDWLTLICMTALMPSRPSSGQPNTKAMQRWRGCRIRSGTAGAGARLGHGRQQGGR